MILLELDAHQLDGYLQRVANALESPVDDAHKVALVEKVLAEYDNARHVL